jgi:hypothetical protein
LLHPWDEERLTAEMDAYQASLDEGCELAYQIAEAARAQGKDLTDRVEIPRASDLAGRTEKLLEEYLDGLEFEDELRELLEAEDRETAAIEMSKRVANRMHVRTGDLVKAIDTGLRVGLAILTEAVLVAPLEGISNVRLLNNADGSQFVSVDFCGPIRAAGGTAQALAVLITDLVRRELGVGPYVARFEEVERVKEEFGLYRKNLQYRPTPEEIDMVVRACPVMVNGESTENEECAGYGILENVDGTRVRGGVMLVIGEGLCLKAPKVRKHTERLKVEGWEFISHFADKGKSDGQNGTRAKRRRIEPNTRFMEDIIAGRPVFGEPSRAGGFRLRYGRTRATGLAAAALSPVTMEALGKFIAVGTQMKIERPGKACAVTPSDELQGPSVLLRDGRFGRIDSATEWRKVAESVSTIWDNGELMLGYGEFLENNKNLVPAAYNRDWWAADICATLTDESSVKTFAKALGCERDDLPPGAPGSPREGGMEQFNFHRAWVRFLVILELDWSAAVRVCTAFNTAVPPPWNPCWLDLPLQWLPLLDEVFAAAVVEVADIAPDGQSSTADWNQDCRSSQSLRLVGAVAGWQHPVAGEQPPEETPGQPFTLPEPLGGVWRSGDHHLWHGVVKASCMLLGIEHHHDGDDIILSRGWEGVVEGLGLQVRASEMTTKSDLSSQVEDRVERLANSLQTLATERVRLDDLESRREKVSTAAKTAARQRGEGIPETEQAGQEAASEVPDEGSADPKLLEAAERLLDEHEVDGSLFVVRRASELRWEHYAPVRIGARMARPEKAAHRVMKTAVNSLFPVAGEGGPQRLLTEASSRGNLRVAVGARECQKCGRPSPFIRCHHRLVPTEPVACNGRTRAIKTDRGKSRWGNRGGEFQTIPLRQILEVKLEEMDLDRIGKVKCVKGLSSRAKTPEPLEKGILRAKHGLPVFRDGTVRFDMSDIPLTHFRPVEIGTRWQHLSELGYSHDVDGFPLTSDGQVLELYPQDFIPSSKGIEHLVKTCEFVDDLLGRFYGMEPFYRVQGRDDLVGKLAIALAPHTSAGVLCRIIGFTDASGGYAHTLFHAAKRRNCDGDEDAILMLLDGLLNFSKEILPANRGGRMDAPLVLSTRLNPTELDKEALNVDTSWFYERGFYEATLDQPHPKELAERMDFVERRIGTIGAVRGYGYTLGLSSLDAGPENSAYKILETMIDKMNAQIELAQVLRAVDVRKVASSVVESHFFPDLRGNLMAFTRQKMRCGRCAAKYRRVPLAGKCIKSVKAAAGTASIIRSNEDRQCGGNLIMTVSEGSVRKYVKAATHMMEVYGTSDYTKQKYGWLAESLDSLFKNDRVTVFTLDDFC